MTVVLNVSGKSVILPAEGASEVLFSTEEGCSLKDGMLTLGAYGGLIWT